MIYNNFLVCLKKLFSFIEYHRQYSYILTGKKKPMRAPVTFPTSVMAPITPELKPVIIEVNSFQS